MDRPRDPVPAFGKKDDAVAGGLLDAIDGSLDRRRVVGGAIAPRAHGVGVHRLRVIEAHGVIGLR